MSKLDCTESDDEDSSEDEEADEEPLYFGKRNAEGLPQGRGTLKWTKAGHRFEGLFVNGSREGRGCFYFRDGSTLSGSYRADKLEGETLYTYSEGSYMVAEYCNGEMEGPFSEYSLDGSVVSTGMHKNGSRTGIFQTFDEFGGSVIGVVSENGQLTGDSIAYIYPDKETALIGQFKNGQLVKARPAKIEATVNNKQLPNFSYRKDYPGSVSFDVSTHDTLSQQPLLGDVYEQDRVCVKRSLIENAGEGLFAKVDLDQEEIASFYNGIRLSHDEVDSRDWSLNDNTLSLDEDTVIDVPAEYISIKTYCATLGHKANHSKHPNCKYDVFCHPRYSLSSNKYKITIFFFVVSHDLYSTIWQTTCICYLSAFHILVMCIRNPTAFHMSRDTNIHSCAAFKVCDLFMSDLVI